MSDAEVSEFLATPGQRMVVATVASDGQPHLTVVWYGLLDGRIAFTIPDSTQKAKNLLRDPRITVMVDAGDSKGDLRGVQIAGRAILDNSMKTKLAVHNSIAQRYPAKPLHDPERTMAKRLAVLVEGHSVASWDHRKLAANDR